MKFKVMIRKNDTREVRFYEETQYNWEDSLEYLWTEGNYGCDCNRAKFFAWADNEKPPEETECGSILYTIPYAILEDGTKVELDDDL